MAQSEAQEGVAIFEEYLPKVRDAKMAALARRDLGDAAITWGNLAFRAGQFDLGRACFNKALAIFRDRLAAKPGDLAARYDLDKVASEYGDWCLMKLNAPAEALQYFHLAQEQNRALCNTHEFVNVEQMGLALGYYRLGLAATRAGQKGDAQKYYARCADLRELRVRELESGSLPVTQRQLLDAKIDRMLVQARLGRTDDVLPFVQVLIKLADRMKVPDPKYPDRVKDVKETKAHYQLFASTGFALLAEAVDPSEPRRAEWTKQALGALRLAIDNGFENLWFLENDPDFDAIRLLSEYNAILEPLRQRLQRATVD
jgi:tetratricopeptide (TPR) repeat protein